MTSGLFRSILNPMKYVVLICGMVLLIASCQTEKPVAREDQNPSIPATQYSLLISQLGGDDWETRESAQKKLEDWPADTIGEIEPAVKEAAESNDPETRTRAIRIYDIIKIRKRVKFSDSFLKEFPDIYRDLTKLDASGRFGCLQKITGTNQKDMFEPIKFIYKDKVLNTDIAGLIGEIIQDNIKGVSDKQKQIILSIVSGELYHDPLSSSTDIEGGWCDIIPEAAPYVIKLLKDDNYVCAKAAEALGKLGAKEAIPRIKELMNRQNEYVHMCAVVALGRLGAKEIIPDLMKFLKSGYVRGSVAQALGYLGVKEAIPDIIKLLKDGAWDVRWSAVSALGLLNAKESVPEIIKLLEDEHHDVRQCAVKTLEQLGDKEIIPAMRKLLNDKDLYMIGYAVMTLAKLGDKESITKIIRLMGFNYPGYGGLRGLFAIALVELGAKDKVTQDIVDDINIIAVNWHDGYKSRARAALKELGVSDEEIEKAKE
ncbi:MAG: HEAT repeat domain-containing protein [Planctomycetes bacterium]|nr:HEAT repeat domain-containing protein [Planctomycetota bacterium]